MNARGWQRKVLVMVGVLAVAVEARARPKAPDPSTPVVDDFRITILADAIPGRKTIGEWGFAALVEVTAAGVTRRFLFDTGDKPFTVRDNAITLGLWEELCSAEDVVLSHHHADHTGGLLPLRQACVAQGWPDALRRVWAGGPALLWSRLGADGKEKNPMVAMAPAYLATGGTILADTDQPRPFLLPGVFLTGHVPRVHDERTYFPVSPMQVWDPELQRYVDEQVPEDQAVVIHTSTATIVLTGCAHSGTINTLLAARTIVGGEPDLVLAGGLHWYQMERGDKHEVGTVDWEAETMRELHVVAMLGGHCTGVERFFYIRDQLKLGASEAALSAVGTILAREPRFTFTPPQAFNIPMQDGE